MEPYYAGWLSLAPPVLAIIFALVSKEVISSLLFGIFSGTLIYCLGSGVSDVPIRTVEIAFTIMTEKVDFNIVVFLTMLGALVFVVGQAGGTRAYGRWATKHIKSKKAAMLSTSGLGVFIFIDDYFNCLTVGTVMRPVTDSYKVSRAKLAYIIDATAAPICIIAPISSWAAAVGSNLKDTGAFESDFAAFIATIPYNFYAILSLVMVVMVCLGNFDFGPMRRAELRAQNGDLGNALDSGQELKSSDRGTVWDMLIPIISLICFAVAGLLYSGGYWGADQAYHSLVAAFGNSSASKALVWASFGSLVVAFGLFVPRGLVGFREFMHGSVDGMKLMMPANIILVLAWTISGVCRDLLQTPEFVKTLVSADSGMTAGLLPAIIFIIAGFLSFSTGTAWGTFGILIPIVVPVAQAVNPELVVVCLSATLAGSVFGDHCSPISDTTILASAGAGCNHIEHVATQIGYAGIVAGCCFVGYLVAGFTDGNLLLSLGSALILMVATMFYLHHRAVKRGKQEEAAIA